MKFITICLIVCTIVLNVSIDFANPQGQPTDIVNTLRTGKGHHRFRPPSFKSILQRQYHALVDRINGTWMQCNQAFDLMRSENAVYPYMPSAHKCLIDCTLRSMGVITYHGIGDDPYMSYMRRVQNNQTSSDDTKPQTFDQMNHQLNHLIRNGTCETIVGTAKTDKYFTDLCTVLIESYSLAASKCTQLHDSYGDNCQSSYMIITCLARRHRGKFYESPFSKIFVDQKNATA